MKSAGEIFRKLKEVKFRHWVVLYKKLSKRTPENCKYNFPYKIINETGVTQIRLCMLHQDGTKIVQPNLIDLCQADIDCQNCNAFIGKYTREQIKKIFLEELNTKQVKEKKYPEICALEWVLEKYDNGLPVISWIQALYFRLKNLLLKNKI